MVLKILQTLVKLHIIYSIIICSLPIWKVGVGVANVGSVVVNSLRNHNKHSCLHKFHIQFIIHCMCDCLQ